MSSRTPYVAANWKMNKTAGEAAAFLDEFLAGEPTGGSAEVVICPPLTALGAVAERCAGTGVKVAAQNMHQSDSGAFTGEVSAAMLLDAGAEAVILGHSERRQLFGETDAALAEKVPVALEAGLEPILCVGETEAQRDAGETEAVLLRQVSRDLAGVTDQNLARVVIAYEPIWAIGTGRTATPEQAEQACEFVRGIIAGRNADAGGRVRVLYGGSVKGSNAVELMQCASIDGALVGGASLDPAEFAAIVAAAG